MGPLFLTVKLSQLLSVWAWLSFYFFYVEVLTYISCIVILEASVVQLATLNGAADISKPSFIVYSFSHLTPSIDLSIFIIEYIIKQ